MNDVKELFNRVLDADAPPPAASRNDMLALAHRAESRRRTLRSAVGCAAVTAVVAGAVAVPQWLAPRDAVTTALSPHLTTPDVPERVTPEQHSRRMLATLLGVVPKHLTTPSAPVVKDSDGIEVQVQGTQAEAFVDQMIATTDVYDGTKSGSLGVTAALVPGPAPTGDLCTAGSVMHQGSQQGCRVVTASNGDRIRFSWRTIRHGRIEYAARFYDGGYVLVQQNPQGMKPGSAPLGRVLSEQALIEAATDRAFWPTNLAPFPDVKPPGGVGGRS